jgi:hypothetical protein
MITLLAPCDRPFHTDIPVRRLLVLDTNRAAARLFEKSGFYRILVGAKPQRPSRLVCIPDWYGDGSSVFRINAKNPHPHF